MKITAEALKHNGFSFYMYLSKESNIMLNFDMYYVRKKSTIIIVN